MYYRTIISLTHDYSELTEFLIKFYVCILFSHKLKSCVCPPPQKLQQEYFAFLGKAGVLFKTKTLNYKDFAFTPSVLFLHILYIIKFSVFPFSVAFWNIYCFIAIIETKGDRNYKNVRNLGTICFISPLHKRSGGFSRTDLSLPTGSIIPTGWWWLWIFIKTFLP